MQKKQMQELTKVDFVGGGVVVVVAVFFDCKKSKFFNIMIVRPLGVIFWLHFIKDGYIF